MVTAMVGARIEQPKQTTDLSAGIGATTKAIVAAINPATIIDSTKGVIDMVAGWFKKG